jgi:hypothetical protein
MFISTNKKVGFFTLSNISNLPESEYDLPKVTRAYPIEDDAQILSSRASGGS